MTSFSAMDTIAVRHPRKGANTVPTCCLPTSTVVPTVVVERPPAAPRLIRPNAFCSPLRDGVAHGHTLLPQSEASHGTAPPTTLRLPLHQRVSKHPVSCHAEKAPEYVSPPILGSPDCVQGGQRLFSTHSSARRPQSRKEYSSSLRWAHRPCV